MDKIKLGIIGMGNMGNEHFSNIVLEGLCPEIELVAVSDKREARHKWIKEKATNVTVFDDGFKLIDSGLVEAVIIATPHYQHPVLSTYAFEKGLHVMCEKPAGVYTKEVRVMNEAAEKSGKTFGMMFNQRINPVYKKMKELVSSGKYGEIRRVNWIITTWFRTQYYYDSGHWRATWAGEGGGVLLNQCPHQLDLLQWICGMPNKVHSFVHEGKWHDIEVEDDVSTYMEFPNGATGIFVTATGDAPGTNRFEVTMDGAKLICEDTGLTIIELDSPVTDYISRKEGFVSIGTETEFFKANNKSEQHYTVLNAFAANILRGEPLVAEGKEGINGLTLSNAMHLSSWTNSSVTIPFDEDKYLELLDKKRANSKVKEYTGVSFSIKGSF